MLLISILPGVLWARYFYAKDKYEPEPVLLLIRDFLVGMAIVLPASLLEHPFRNALAPGVSLPLLFMGSVFVVGLVEEGLKAGAVYFLHHNDPEFNEPVDGMIYGIMVGLGFAAFENLLYSLVFGYSVGLSRAILTNLLHASFTGIFGYYYSRSRIENRSGLPFWGLGLVTTGHGIYNFLILAGFIGTIEVIVIVVILQIILASLFKIMNRQSPFKPQ